LANTKKGAERNLYQQRVESAG